MYETIINNGPPWNIRVTLGNLLFRYNSGDPTSISYKLQVRRQFTTKWKLELVQNGVSNFKIIQFGSKNARSGTHRVFPIGIPMSTIWCVSSFLIPCNFHSTTIWSGWPFLDFPNSCFPDKMCVNRTLYPTLTNPPDIYIQFGEKFRGTDTNGITGKTRCRIPVKTTLQNASTQR